MSKTLFNSPIKFISANTGTVAFMGGSITEMEGYRPLVCEQLQKRFPKTRFTFINAGISPTTSTTGAFRFEHDVLSKGPIDLLFLEFAVNDEFRNQQRRARHANPRIYSKRVKLMLRKRKKKT